MRYLFQFLKWLADCERLDTDDCFCADWGWDLLALKEYGFELPKDCCVALFNREGTETLSDKKRYILEAFLVTDKDVIDITYATPLFTDLTSFLESLGLHRKRLFGYIIYCKPGDGR